MSDLIRPVFDFSGRSANRAESLLERIRPLGVQAHFIAGDITDPAYCERLSTETVSLIGVPDFLVNSAGVIYHATTEETSDAQWHHTFNVNVHGTFYLCRAVIPAMRSSGGGVIINIASDAALGGSPHLVAYCASKGAVLQMTRAMAVDHARDNIRVLAICPGDVDTAMLRGEFDARGMGVDQGLAESAEAVPLNRVCSPEEIADLVLFSCSDSARFITGSPLVIDGGSLA